MSHSRRSWHGRLWRGRPARATPARPGRWALAAACLAGLLSAGCPPPRDTSDLTEIRQLRQQNAALQADLQTAQVQLQAQQKHIQKLQALGDRKLDLLFTVTRIELGNYTAGVDLDKAPGDDGVRVYLLPLDRDGNTLKAAGSVLVQLFDLAAPPEKNLLGQHDYPVEKIGQYWAGGFLTYHYRFDCPWKAPPAHDEITVRVTFTDYLTGRTFAAQKVVTVKLPPATQPATSSQPGTPGQ